MFRAKASSAKVMMTNTDIPIFRMLSMRKALISLKGVAKMPCDPDLADNLVTNLILANATSATRHKCTSWQALKKQKQQQQMLSRIMNGKQPAADEKRRP